MATILDRYVNTLPDPQNAVDIFQETWSFAFPAPFEHLVAGQIVPADDTRISWAAEKLGGFADKTVLELGPLEAMHTYQLEQQGAAAVTAIEANTTAYLKCLVVKETLGLTNTRVLCGDFVPYLRSNQQPFDVCVASGVLYHMRRPAELIGLIARATNRVFLWTHYYDHEIASRRSDKDTYFPQSGPAVFGGFAHTLHRQEYHQALGWASFCGGNAPYSYWMSRDDILGCLRHFGFDQIQIGFESSAHSSGPSFAVAATRSNPGAMPSADQLGAEYEIDPELLERETRGTYAEAAASPAEADHAGNELLTGVLSEQQLYSTRLEQTIAQKNQHIAHLEHVIQRYDAGLLMRLLRRLRR